MISEVTRPEGKVADSVADALNRVDELEQAISELEKRLDSALIASTPESEKESIAPPTREVSPLNNSILLLSSRILRTRCRLENILDRLDL
jgi:hypothetical protein